MPIQVRLIVADSARLDWLKNILGCDPDLVVVSDDPNVDRGPEADLFIVDLAHPQASLPRLWILIRQLHLDARVLAIIEASIDEAALQAALHAGVHHFAEWPASPGEFWDMAWAAYENLIRGDPVDVCLAATALFRRLNQVGQPLQIGDLRIELIQPQVTRDRK